MDRTSVARRIQLGAVRLLQTKIAEGSDGIMAKLRYNLTATQDCMGLSLRGSEGLTMADYQEELWGAACDGNKEEVERLVSQQGLDPNKETRGGYLALCEAAAHGQTDTVFTLVRLGADVNLAESRGGRHTPLAESRESENRH